MDKFKERASEKLQLNRDDVEPLASNDFNWDGKKWRILLYPGTSKCQLYVQLKQALSPVRVAIRYDMTNL